MKRNVVILAFILIEVFAVFNFARCGGFAHHFSSFDLSLRLIADIHADRGISLIETRVFHNKILGALLDTFNLYLSYWSLTFLNNFLSPAGLLGLGAGFYYFIKSKKRSALSYLLFALVLIIPFVEIFEILKSVNWVIGITVFALPYILFSIYGWCFLTNKITRNKLILFIILSALSICYSLVAAQLLSPLFC